MLSYRVFEFKNICTMGLTFSIILLAHLSQCILDIKNPKCVFALGQNLTGRLTGSPSGTKEDLINDLTDYYIYLNTAFRVEEETYPKIKKEVLQKLKYRGGPPFLGVEMNDQYLESSFGMGAVEVDHVKEVVVDIKRLWNDIKKGVTVPPEFANY